ncbi:uncharacterized protein cubi_03541 [Cryptosporidium ubiquitum]|uniref:AP2/ERF domain-containing protein n=1 Tax=Cryptosporidium ubiquitum TaxID=857276 RepID=A0A1J4MI94_9CRYT|nr:uncharacterized protein cubi_03541 [Cryptosporidium ubiquitum]OII73743.1 hypothetical protein cubi_03541 [Cryptosporidium ubiquitum]
MTETNNDLHLKDENTRDLQKKEDLDMNLISQNCNPKMRDTLQGNANLLSNGKDEIFMQLQTELFDILLEIYNLIPTWGSFKENFYFHWKRIIGACNFKDLHAYRLIFRCLGNLRPSSTPIFILRPIIKQLDEYRKISEPEYSSSNFELNSNIQGNIITSSQTPIVMFQNTQTINIPNVLVEEKQKILLENKIGPNLSPDKYNSNLFHGIINENKECSGLGIAGINEKNFVPFSKFENDTISSVQSKDNLNILFDNIFNSVNKNIYFSDIKKHENFSIDIEKSSEDMKLTNELFNKETTFSDDYNTNEVINNTFMISNYCNSNSKVSSPYGSTCTTSSLSPTECNIAVPIMAAFQHIQAVAVAAAVVNNTKNKLNSVNDASNEHLTIQPKKRPRRNGDIQGVYFDKIRKLWRANWKENGRVKTKGFSVFQFGDEGARQRAIEYRKRMEKEFYIMPHSKFSRSSSNDGTIYINSEKALGSEVSAIKKGTERGSNLNNILNSSRLSSEDMKFSENSNSNLNN